MDNVCVTIVLHYHIKTVKYKVNVRGKLAILLAFVIF
jgi:hypothetical protein